MKVQRNSGGPRKRRRSDVTKLSTRNKLQYVDENNNINEVIPDLLNMNKVPDSINLKDPKWHHTKRAAKTTTLCVLPLLASSVFFMTILSGAQASFHVKEFNQSQSLYFDKISNMQIIRDEWKLIIYYDMRTYWSGLLTLQNYTMSLERICKSVNTNKNCEIILMQLNQGLTQLEYYNQVMLGHSSSLLRRKRRGLIDAIGNIQHALFGVLDSKFAEQYKKDITLLQDNQRHMASYWQNQTSIIETGYALLNQTRQKMDQQNKIITQHLSDMENALNRLKLKAQNSLIVNEIAVGAIIGSNMLNSLKTLQNTLLDAITNIYRGHFNPHLLTPAQLREQLSIIASQLSKDVSLPIDNVHTDLAKIYKLLQVKARMLESYLIFEIKIPLVSRDTFEIFKVLPIPQVRGRNMVSIVPISQYLAVNLKKEAYITLTSDTLSSCLVSDVHLCHIQKPIYRLKADKDYCQTDRGECKTETAPCKSTWLESNTMHYYLYFCCGQCPLRIICEEDVTSHELKGAGMVVMDNGCVIKTDSFTVVAHKQQTSAVTLKPDIYAPLIPSINHIVNITVPHVVPQNNTADDASFNKQLSVISEKIKVMKENAILSDSVSFHDIHHYTLIYGIIGLAGVALVVMYRRRSNNNAPKLLVRDCEFMPPSYVR